METKSLSMAECEALCQDLVRRIWAGQRQSGGMSTFFDVYGIPRGGMFVAMMLARQGSWTVESDDITASIWFNMVDDPSRADVIVDDLIDSGRTAERFHHEYQKPVMALLDKRDNPEMPWVTFPWETRDGAADAGDIVTRMLQVIGEDTSREGLQDTPARVEKAWGHWFSGYDQDPAEVLKVFEDGAEGCDEMVLQTDIPIYSHCEHHTAPIFGVAHIAYIPKGKVVGLSKIKRVADIFARRLQVQERLTNQIADAIEEHLDPLGVGVVLQCRHFCMESRGIQQQGIVTTTSALRGAFKQDHDCRAEFMSLIGMTKKGNI